MNAGFISFSAKYNHTTHCGYFISQLGNFGNINKVKLGFSYEMEYKIRTVRMSNSK